MTWALMWLNRSVATINATLQLLDIYRFVHPRKSIISFLHDCLAAAWTCIKELVNITNWILIWS